MKNNNTLHILQASITDTAYYYRTGHLPGENRRDVSCPKKAIKHKKHPLIWWRALENIHDQCCARVALKNVLHYPIIFDGFCLKEKNCSKAHPWHPFLPLTFPIVNGWSWITQQCLLLLPSVHLLFDFATFWWGRPVSRSWGLFLWDGRDNVIQDITSNVYHIEEGTTIARLKDKIFISSD